MSKKLIILIIAAIVSIGVYEISINRYSKEREQMTTEEIKIIDKVIELSNEKIGLEYVWGGKGEIMTKERLNELINYYGISHYPLNKDDYIGKQAFDCSGLTYYTYKQITGIDIGYSTREQKEVLKDYKVDIKNLQPGDLIFTPGHVVLYIGKGKIIHAASKSSYPSGGVKEGRLKRRGNIEVYRPVKYIEKNLQKTN